jgi:hypothetical protein
MDEKILDMFLREKHSPYEIHLETGCSIKRITETIAQSIEARKRHQEALRRQKELEDAS